MQRRKFIRNLAGFSAAAWLSRALPIAGFINNDGRVSGRVTSGKKGIPDVVVSDGYSVVVTDSKGRFELTPNPAARSVFVSTPAGYEFITEKGLARHYMNVGDSREMHFKLKKLTKDDNDHQFIIWADPQVKNKSDVAKMMAESVPDVQRFVAAAGSETLLHGITVGDIVWDQHDLYPEYNKAVEKMGIPFFQCLGNHDMDYDHGGDETSDVTFQQYYGPTYYSFNRGKAHYVVMDNVRYLGKDRDYDGFFQQNQLDWLQKDLSFVPQDHLVILCVHIPVHSGVKNKEALYTILDNRNVHIMSGHTHYHVNNIHGSVYEHNHGTVCGAWWTGPICCDGTPCGYGVYHVKGTALEWYYQSTGEQADHQIRLFITDNGAGGKDLLANIWNHDAAWTTEYWIDGNHSGALEPFETFDPMAYKTMLGPDLPKPRGFAEPRKTDHIFKGKLTAGATQVRVVATDRFGKKFEAAIAV